VLALRFRVFLFFSLGFFFFILFSQVEIVLLLGLLSPLGSSFRKNDLVFCLRVELHRFESARAAVLFSCFRMITHPLYSNFTLAFCFEQVALQPLATEGACDVRLLLF
jgi:hypothetical protein